MYVSRKLRFLGRSEIREDNSTRGFPRASVRDIAVIACAVGWKGTFAHATLMAACLFLKMASYNMMRRSNLRGIC